MSWHVLQEGLPRRLTRQARDRQTLYTTRDNNVFYFGWRGAWWSLDGTMFIYLDAGAGSATQPVTVTVPAVALPFAADYAVAITGPAQGTLYCYAGSAWQAQAGLTFAQSGPGDAEVRVPIGVSGLSDVRLLAFALSDSKAVWSVFPTTNPLKGVWTDAYRWQPICSVTAPNANQPRGVSVVTSLTSLESSSTPYSPTATLRYVVALDNRKAGVDNISPNVSMALPAFITSTLAGYAQINGTASIHSRSAVWPRKSTCRPAATTRAGTKASGPYSPMQGSRGWSFTWLLPTSDSMPVRFRARAIDAAGNLAVGAWRSTPVDTVAPVITATAFISRIEPWKYQSPLRTGPPVLTGTITDGGIVTRLWAQVYGPHGAAYTDAVTSTGDVWAYTPLFTGWPVYGAYGVNRRHVCTQRSLWNMRAGQRERWPFFARAAK